FENVPPTADQDSFRVKAFGEGIIQIDGIEIREEALEEDFSGPLQKLNQEMLGVSDEIFQVESKQKRLLLDKNYILSMKNHLTETLVYDFGIAKTNVLSLKNHFTEIEESELGILTVFFELENEKKNLLQKKNLIQRKINLLGSGQKKNTLAAEIQFSVLKAGSIRLILNYILPGASWNSFYDARLLVSSSSMEIGYYAGVSQSTGENWEEIDLVLSTSNPSHEASLPKIKTWFIDLNETDGFMASEPKPLVQKNSGGTAVNFLIPKKETVNPDGSRKKTMIDTITLPVTIEYILMPKKAPHAFIKATAVNDREYPFLPGEVSVYHDFDFIGHSAMPLTIRGEKMSLYMGIDESIQVERELINRIKASKGFTNNQEQIVFKYKTTIQNFKNQPVSILLFEPLPVSKNSELKVKLEKSEPEYSEKDEKSILQWKLTLAPQEKKIIFYEFSVTWPAEKTLVGLE
ncbi:MAG TPA: hypothetical protein DHW82_04625, partial [Spirochaetia bacterium]|nr:hypothetical protein [Spirochaetia bacterium]